MVLEYFNNMREDFLRQKMTLLNQIHACENQIKEHEKMIHMMEILEDKGVELREPYTKPLGDGIFELRCKQANNITRALFFFILVEKLLLPMVLLKRHLKLRARKFV